MATESKRSVNRKATTITERNDQMTGAELISAERFRQTNIKGWSSEHDDGHSDGSLLHAGLLIGCEVAGLAITGVDPPSIDGPWPDRLALHVAEKYQSSRLRRLAIAGAMIAAEMDRILREDPDAEKLLS